MHDAEVARFIVYSACRVAMCNMYCGELTMTHLRGIWESTRPPSAFRKSYTGWGCGRTSRNIYAGVYVVNDENHRGHYDMVLFKRYQFPNNRSILSISTWWSTCQSLHKATNTYLPW